MSTTSPGATPIDPGRFAAAYRSERGEEPANVPVSLEALFERLHDPDELASRTVSILRAAASAIERQDCTLDTDPEISTVTVYPGHVRARTHFTIDSHVLVLGDLDVDGVVTALPAHAILMVAGNVRCHAMQLVRAYLFVTGDVILRDCFLGTAYGLSKVAGTIRAPIYLEDASWANLAVDASVDGEPTRDNIEASLVLDVESKDARSRLASRLVPGALGDVGEGVGSRDLSDVFALFDRIADGDRIVLPERTA